MPKYRTVISFIIVLLTAKKKWVVVSESDMSLLDNIDTPPLPVRKASPIGWRPGPANDAGSDRYARAARARGKRFADIVLALSALVLFSIVFLLVALAIRVSSPGPVLYRHMRVGRNGKSFGCLKFRTMVTNGDEVLTDHLARDEAARIEWGMTRKLRNDPRITPIGTMLRSTSLDELPQLLNILRGEMSVVGPRPVVQDELALYGTHVDAYLAARPGLTGLWQVSGRNDVSYDERVRLDREYVEGWTMRNDVILILRTVPAVLARRGSC